MWNNKKSVNLSIVVCFILSAVEKFAENSCEYGFVGTFDEALNKAIG